MQQQHTKNSRNFNDKLFLFYLKQVGIIGGSGLDDPEILEDRREIYRETPYGTFSCIFFFFFFQKNFFIQFGISIVK